MPTSLARVTSYNKLERNTEEKDLDSSFEQEEDPGREEPQDEPKNQDLVGNPNVIQLDQGKLSLAKQLMDEGSPNSIQSHPNVLNQEELKESMRRSNFFVNRMNQSGSTSHDDLHNDPSVLKQLNNLNTQPLASPTMPNTTPLSTDSGA